MVGNSWIYKAKYNGGDEKDAPKKSEERMRDSEKKQRSKSKSRNIFNRMKSSS